MKELIIDIAKAIVMTKILEEEKVYKPMKAQLTNEELLEHKFRQSSKYFKMKRRLSK